MAQIFPGRYAAHAEDSFAVFLIGMRINKLWAVHKWLPVVQAMGPMISRLYRFPEHGFLGGQTLLAWPGVTMIQYWKSAEDLGRFAHSPAEPHLAAWRAFAKNIGDDGSVGIWHETYVVEAGAAEAIYGNMPRVGLGSVMEHIPATDPRAKAQRRRYGEKPAGVAS